MPDRTVESAGFKGAREEPLLQRDWILLPLISLLTISLMLGSTELIARRMFGASKTGYERCMVLDDPTTGARGIPNSVCWEKPPEGPWVEYRFNGRGHRAGVELRPKAADTYRIVLMGSSMALGQYVRREETFAALLPGELTERTGRKVELYNEGMGFGFAHSATLRFKDVLAAQPDVILWILTPPDISRGAEVKPRGNPDPGAGLNFPQKTWRRLHAALASQSIESGAADLFSYSKTAYMLRHFLFESQSETLKATFISSDSEAGYLKADPSAAWRNLLKNFESDAAAVQGEANSSGVPFAAVLVPGRGQAAMISTGEWPAGFDPYELGKQLRSIIVSHGGFYIDILHDFCRLPNAERFYFPMDGHPNAEGHSVISSMLARELTAGAIPALRVAAPAQNAMELGK